MGVKDWIIKKLEDDVESDAGHINLEEFDEETREKLFTKFGEGDKNLTTFLRTAYEHGAPSIFCCSGHGIKYPYVWLKVTDDNIELLRKIGKVLSNEGVSTNFVNHCIKGKIVDYVGVKSTSTEWFSLATKVMQNPELYNDVVPSIYYHESINEGYKPLGFNIKKRLLSFLRRDKKALPSCEDEEKTKAKSSSKKTWEINERIIISPTKIPTSISSIKQDEERNEDR